MFIPHPSSIVRRGGWPLILFLVVVNLFTVSARGVTQNTDALPVTDVTLFNTGVGNFRHEGLVRGDSEITLSFDAADIDDLLKSLVLQDYDGGIVEAVSYPSQDPLSRILGSFSLDISDNPPLARLLDRARGESLRVVSSSVGTLEGRVVGVEYRRIIDGNDRGVGERTPEIPVVNLLTADGFRQLKLRDIESFTFLNPELQADLDAALGLIASNRHEDKKSLTLRFSGEGERRVSFSYVREVPVWKTSYRLVLDDDTAQIQGWGMVENTGESDWNDVSLALATAMPISFVMDLYSPIYVPRPRVYQDYGVAAAPQQYGRDRALADSPAPVPERSARKMDMFAESESMPDFESTTRGGAGAPVDLSLGVQSAAVAEGEYFYRISRPVSLPRRGAAMLPIIGTDIPARRLSIYDSRVLQAHPLKAIRISNTSDVRLPAGPATIFDGSQYAGDAQLPSMSREEERLLSYAVDTESSVLLRTSSEPETITELRIAKGFLESSVRLVSTTEYLIDSAGDSSAGSRAANGTRYLVVHPKKSGWTIEGDVRPSSETQVDWHFELSVAAGESGSLSVVEQRIQSRRFALNTIRDEQIVFYLSQRVLDSDTRLALETIRRLRADLSNSEAARADIERKISAIHREQDRIRQNLEALESGSNLYRRYVSVLDGQEDELEKLTANLTDAERKVQAARRTLEDFIAGL